MVPLKINLYELKEELKRALIHRLSAITPYEHPLDWAWIAYAFSCDGQKNNPLFEQSVDALEKWAISEEAGIKDKNLAPLCLCYFLSSNQDIKHIISNKAESILKRVIIKKGITKFSPLNDPEQVFCVTLGLKDIITKYSHQLIEIIIKNMNGRPLRKALYLASLFEMERNTHKLPEVEGIQNPEDIITILWLFERYKSEHSEKIKFLWKSYENVHASIGFDITDSEGLILISNRTLALLYETVTKETKGPNPDMLFDLYPLHPQIKKIAEKHFKSKNYVGAIFEATKKLNEFIQNITEIKDKEEVKLVQATMKQNNPIIVFNDFFHEKSGENEHFGLALIAEGIFKAFRNPKGHKPEDHPMLKMDPYEALDQLIIIDYIWKRIEQARINKK